ncbi:MFS transporter [Streptomyces sp. I05A-00742]|uniref:MFS transporter n=1 Tax=Streptomyces sp. I05A-00742 TaxID=2732853 RepID=UPI0014890772|nr:MFS transporter [Streptomyces sp. I05A-00742]
MNDTAPKGSAAPPSRRAAVTLALVLLGMLTLSMSMSGTTVALPDIGEDLGASGASLQWAVTGYFLTASSFMLVTGALADLFGRRRVYRTGAALFTVGLLLSATATDVLLLDAARAVAGLGAAGVMASAGALLATTFSGPARTKAYAALGTTGGIGLAAGPTLSGALVGAVGWRAGFLVFAAVGAVLLAGTFLIAESRSAVRPRLDVPGAVTFIVALALVMTGVTQGPQNGWSHPLVLAAFGVGALLLGLFAVLQRRSAHPVLDLTLVRDRRYLAWTLAGLTGAVGFAGSLTYLPTYFQGVNGVSAGEAGTTMLLLTAPVLVAPLISAQLVTRGVPARLVITVAIGLVAAGNAWLTVLEPGMGLLPLAGPLLTIGIGTGLANGIIDGQAMSLVDPERSGTAAGFLNTVRGGGQAMMIAALGAVMLSLLQDRVGSSGLAAQIASGHLAGPDHAHLAQQFTGAWHTALWGIAGLTAALCVAVAALLRAPRPASRPAAPVTEDAEVLTLASSR